MYQLAPAKGLSCPAPLPGLVPPEELVLEDELEELLLELEDELELLELLELEELLLEPVCVPQVPRLVHEASLPGTVFVYQFA